ncbi:ComEC/Rec2 family competence protein [Candidatus Electronema sp. TJ]|uniref:ComEC/Rec2 family competence protein n=1 Tax=Candidatus Electronema sp. TJ TaxID=3401573 RepID=UPI003AA83440
MMKIYTLNVGQGQFVVVTGQREAFIIDTWVPLNPKTEIVNVKAALASILQGKNLIGLMVTGFDADHFNEVGLRIVLNKYRPDWVMYPKYFKKTGNADTCFSVIKSFEQQKEFRKISVSLSKNDTRFYRGEISSEFEFEIFSPHSADMTSSNNCSLVCKVRELSTGATYLITGDTENDRWSSITRYFGSALQSQVLDAPHHGSKNGISAEAIKLIKPDTVLVSAGYQNQYGHPDREATSLFTAHAKKWYSTHTTGGISLMTQVSSNEVNTYKFEP